MHVDYLQEFLKALATRGIPVHLECSHHSWLVSVEGEPAYTGRSAADVHAFLAGMLTATTH